MKIMRFSCLKSSVLPDKKKKGNFEMELKICRIVELTDDEVLVLNIFIPTSALTE